MNNLEFSDYFNRVNISIDEMIKNDYPDEFIQLSNNQPISDFSMANFFTLLNNYNSISDLESNYFENYILVNGDRPDIIADKVYDNISLWWLVLMLNDITYFDFPISEDNTLNELRDEIYQNEYLFSQEFYLESILKNINNSIKRNIKVVKKQYLNDVLSKLFK